MFQDGFERCPKQRQLLSEKDHDMLLNIQPVELLTLKTAGRFVAFSAKKHVGNTELATHVHPLGKTGQSGIRTLLFLPVMKVSNTVEGWEYRFPGSQRL